MELYLRTIGWVEQAKFRLACTGMGSKFAPMPTWWMSRISRAALRRTPWPTATVSNHVACAGPVLPKPAWADIRVHATPILRVIRNGLIVLMLIAGTGLLALFAGLWSAYEPPKTFEALHLKNARPAIQDRDGELVGAAPGFRQSSFGSGAVSDDEARMAALMVRDVPPVWWDVTVALEDRRFGQVGWVRGIDLIALPNLLLGRRGGSTLPMQIIGNLSGDKSAEIRETGRVGKTLAKARRKLRELASAPALVAATSAYDYLWLKRLAATHLPVMQGQIGGSTVGIASSAWVMFGKTPMELGPGEAAIFAAALKRNILIRRAPDDRVRRDWAYVKERAKRGLELAYPAGDQRREVGLREIDAMPDVPPLFFDDGLPLPARAHVAYRRAVLARTATTEAQAELADRFGSRALAEMPVRGYSLTLSALDNYRFKLEMDALAQEITERAGRECRLYVPLARSGFSAATHQLITTRPNCAPADLPTDERAHVVMALANEKGELIRYYQSGSAEPIYGGVTGRAGNDGRYAVAAEIRDIGSVAKLLAAVLLAEVGDTPDQTYCRKYSEGRLDSDGATGYAQCSAPGAMIPARVAFARSSNLALLWRLRQLPSEKLVEGANAMGFRLASGVEPAYALAFGLVRGSPKVIHEFMHQLGLAATGHPATRRGVHIVKDLDLAEPALAPATRGSQLPQILRRYLAKAEAQAYVQDVLSAVVSHPAGTLRALRPFSPAMAGSAYSLHLAKTGTPVAEGNLPSDKLVTGAVIKDEHYYSYVFLVRAPNPGRVPLGRNLGIDKFAPMLAALLDEAIPAEAGAGKRPKIVRAKLAAGTQDLPSNN